MAKPQSQKTPSRDMVRSPTIASWEILLIVVKEYVRARVKNVHDRKTTRVAERNPDNTFHVKNLAVTDYYV